MRSMKKRVAWVCIALLCTVVYMILGSGCAMVSEERVKMKDLEFTILSEEVIPEELKSIIDEKKADNFKLTYSDNDYLYICIGYGEQGTGGYSIAVNELYLSKDAIYVNTELLEPKTEAGQSTAPSTPYIVIKIEKLDETVIFE